MGTVMEPRELWDRHTVLAKAFCHSDEEVRAAQTTLDDAQASRARSLAAFAVVVGNDKAVAEMLGLPEREVRIARRTVGREDARVLADELLLPAARTHSAGAGAPASTGTGTGTGTGAGHATAAHSPPPSASEDTASRTQEQPQTHEAAQTPDPMGWSPVQDAVLIDGWQAGVDMEILAVELGTDLPRLIARAQYLSAQGRLFAQSDDGVRQGGKHRRDTGAAAHYASMQAAASGPQPYSPVDMLIPDGLLPDGNGGYWANWNEMLTGQ